MLFQRELKELKINKIVTFVLHLWRNVAKMFTFARFCHSLCVLCAWRVFVFWPLHVFSNLFCPRVHVARCAVLLFFWARAMAKKKRSRWQGRWRKVCVYLRMLFLCFNSEQTYIRLNNKCLDNIKRKTTKILRKKLNFVFLTI